MDALKQISAAIGLALAGAALAQAPAPAPAQGGAWPSADQQRRTAQQPAQPPPPASSTPQKLNQEQLQALGQVWMLSQHHAAIGDVAKERGSTGEVKKLADAMQQGHRGFMPVLANALKARGVDPASLPRPAERTQLDQETDRLKSLSGPEFDRAFVMFMKQNGEQFVNALKRARDATPGKDAELKKLLDNGEDTEETYLTEARRLDSQQAQGRTPPRR